jgi:hypothetical protein
MVKKIVLIVIGTLSVTTVFSRDINVSTGAELQNAMENALPGDNIILAPGNYTAKRGSTSGEDARGMFFSKKSGTSSAPITVRARDMNNRPTLSGKDESGTVIGIYLKGAAIDSTNSTYVEYWNFVGVNVVDGMKGVIFDACRHITMKHCSVSNIDQEGIHIRDNSSSIIIDSTSVHMTGRTDAAYGEGFYIGTDKNSQGIPPASGKYRPFCNFNIIKNCRVGPGVTAEHFDVKEGTIGNVIEHNTLDGAGISGANSANTFINDKAQETIIRYNTGNKNSNTNITAFGDVSDRGVYQSGKGGWWYYNTFNGASATDYMVTHAEGKPSAFKWTNTKPAGGNMYSTNVAWTDKNPDITALMETPDISHTLFAPHPRVEYRLTRENNQLMVIQKKGTAEKAFGIDGTYYKNILKAGKE